MGIKSRLHGLIIFGPPIYKTIWTPYLCEELILAAEESNLFDRHAVVVLKTGKIVDHMPNELAQVLLKKRWCSGLIPPTAAAL